MSRHASLIYELILNFTAFFGIYLRFLWWSVPGSVHHNRRSSCRSGGWTVFMSAVALMLPSGVHLSLDAPSCSTSPLLSQMTAETLPDHKETSLQNLGDDLLPFVMASLDNCSMWQIASTCKQFRAITHCLPVLRLHHVVGQRDMFRYITIGGEGCSAICTRQQLSIPVNAYIAWPDAKVFAMRVPFPHALPGYTTIALHRCPGEMPKRFESPDVLLIRGQAGSTLNEQMAMICLNDLALAFSTSHALRQDGVGATICLRELKRVIVKSSPQRWDM